MGPRRGANRARWSSVQSVSYAYKAKKRIDGLVGALKALQQRDPDQEVRGIALPVLDAVLEAVKNEIGRDNPVVISVAARTDAHQSPGGAGGYVRGSVRTHVLSAGSAR
jgi:hypothetical protein